MNDPDKMKQLLEGKHAQWLPVLSGSMAPTILPGDDIFINPGITSFKTGDIVVFYKEGQFVSHRIIFLGRKKTRSIILEKGDANRHADSLSLSNIFGRVTKIRRGDRVQFLTEPAEELKAKKLATKSFVHLLSSASRSGMKRKLKKWIS